MKLIELSSLYRLTELSSTYSIWAKAKFQKYNEQPLVTYSWRPHRVGKARKDHFISESLANKIIKEYDLPIYAIDYEYIEITAPNRPANIHSNESISSTSIDMNDNKRYPHIRRIIDKQRNLLAEQEKKLKEETIKQKHLADLMNKLQADPQINSLVKAFIANYTTSTNPDDYDTDLIKSHGVDWYFIVTTRQPVVPPQYQTKTVLDEDTNNGTE